MERDRPAKAPHMNKNSEKPTNSCGSEGTDPNVVKTLVRENIQICVRFKQSFLDLRVQVESSESVTTEFEKYNVFPKYSIHNHQPPNNQPGISQRSATNPKQITTQHMKEPTHDEQPIKQHSNEQSLVQQTIPKNNQRRFKEQF